MEEVEMFLAPLTARSKVREVLRGLVATRQVHTISMGHAPHFYVAGTLPEFSAPASLYGGSYSSSAMPASSAFLRSFEHDHDAHETSAPVSNAGLAATPSVTRKAPETAPRIAAEAEEKPRPAQPHFSRKPARARDRKPAPSFFEQPREPRPGADQWQRASRLSSALGARRLEKRQRER